MGWIKVMGSDGMVYLYSGITEPEKVMDHLLDELHKSHEDEKEMIKAMIKHHEESPLCVITGKEKIPFDKEIHSNL
jgi:hypothetical protein